MKGKTIKREWEELTDKEKEIISNSIKPEYSTDITIEGIIEILTKEPQEFLVSWNDICEFVEILPHIVDDDRYRSYLIPSNIDIQKVGWRVERWKKLIDSNWDMECLE